MDYMFYRYTNGTIFSEQEAKAEAAEVSYYQREIVINYWRCIYQREIVINYLRCSASLHQIHI